MATLLARMLILGVLVGARAQSDFCEGFPAQHQLQNVEYVEEQVQLKYLKPGDPTPRVTDNSHDLVAGNCDLRGTTLIRRWYCAEPVTGEVAFIDVGYVFLTNYAITCIKNLDRMEDGNGGFSAITDGGLGFNSVIINNYGQRGQGLRVYTEVFAAKIQAAPGQS